MKLIVGLGNPGKKYDKTRHNIGFMVIDKYVNSVKWIKKFNAEYIKLNVDGEEVIFIKPLTYMNLSGNSVGSVINYYNIDINDILIIQDDLDMAVGTYKIKKNTSSGGHNGIKSIESILKSNSFVRLKIGILNDNKEEVIDFVLSKLTKEECELISNIDTNKIIDMFISKGYEYTINHYKE